MKVGLSITEPIRITPPSILGELPNHRSGSSTSTVDGTTHGFYGMYSSNDEWKRNFSKFKYQRMPHSPNKRKPISMADAQMIGLSAGRSGNILKQAQMKLASGILEDNRNQWKKAVRHFAKACKLYKEANDLAGESISCNFAAVSCYDAGDYEKSILFSAKQRRLASQMLHNKKYTSMAGEHFCYALNNEGLCHRKLNNPNKAESCHRRILGFAQRDDAIGDDENERLGAESLANGHLGLDMLAKTRSKKPSKSMSSVKSSELLKNQSAAENNLHEHLITTLNQLTISRNNDYSINKSSSRIKKTGRLMDPNSVFQSRLNLAMLSLQKGDYSIAKKYNEEANIQAKKNNNKIQILTSSVHLGISKGQIKLENMLKKINVISKNDYTIAPLELKKMMEKARYNKKDESEDEKIEEQIHFGVAKIIYH